VCDEGKTQPALSARASDDSGNHPRCGNPEENRIRPHSRFPDCDKVTLLLVTGSNKSSTISLSSPAKVLVQITLPAAASAGFSAGNRDSRAPLLFAPTASFNQDNNRLKSGKETDVFPIRDAPSIDSAPRP
jgi:hypothetical protein